MTVQADRESRVTAAAAEIRSRITLDRNLAIGGLRLSAEIARKIAEAAVDAVIAADNDEAERWAKIRRTDKERRRRET